MLRIARYAATMWLTISGCTALMCHCLNKAACNPIDGSCYNGCEKGWYGPGCQLGNLALNKPAFQSSTYADYIAENAVNGFFPPLNDETESNCSHTQESNTRFHWWYVILSDSEDYVLKNITIVNRQGYINEKHLKNFYILYTRDMNTNPDPTTWEQCTFVKQYQSTTVASYTCENNTAIGRRVAVYLVPGSSLFSTAKLALCEVYIDGYSYNESSMFQNIVTSVTPNCESIEVNFSTLPIVPPTYLMVHLTDHSKPNFIYLERIRNLGNGLRSVVVRSTANRTYSISVSPEICCIGPQCLDNFTSDNSKCVTGQSTNPVNVKTPPHRKYGLKKTGFILSIISLTQHPCSSDSQRVKCSDIGNRTTSTVDCSETGSCELDPRYNYKCILESAFKDGSTEISTENIYVSSEMECPPVNELDTSEKTSRVIGGAVAAFIVLSAVILVGTLKFRMHEIIRERARLRLPTTNRKCSCKINSKDCDFCIFTSTSQELNISPPISDRASTSTDSPVYDNTVISDVHDMDTTTVRDLSRAFDFQLPQLDCQYESLHISNGASNEADYDVLQNNN